MTTNSALASTYKKSISPITLKVDICYHSGNKQYYKNDGRGCWISITEKSAERFLMKDGFNSHPAVKGTMSEVDMALAEIQEDQSIVFAGRLAGYRSGVYEMNHQKILVTESPIFIEPVKKSYPTLEKLLVGLFGDVQLPYIYGWLHVAMTAAYTNKVQPGQALILAGPPSSGKSLFQRLLTIMLGDRVAKPHAFMTKATSFNSEIIGSEHLMIEDEAAAKSAKGRMAFASAIKSFTVNEDQYCHAKYQVAVNLRPRWQRLSISVNDEPESLLVIPPLDAGLKDKLMLIQVSKKRMPMPTETAEEQELFWMTLMEELPGFIDFLLSWTIPTSMTSSRFGVTHYHHPELLEAMNSLSPEDQLWEMIEEVLFSGGSGKVDWKGSAAQLQDKISTANSVYRSQISNLCTWPSACGVYLGRLEKRFATRISNQKVTGRTRWTILSNATSTTLLHVGIAKKTLEQS